MTGDGGRGEFDNNVLREVSRCRFDFATIEIVPGLGLLVRACVRIQYIAFEASTASRDLGFCCCLPPHTSGVLTVACIFRTRVSCI